MATRADKSTPFFPLAGGASDGYSKDGEATATCFCGAVQLAFPTEAPGLVSTFVCNCSDCRKITASMFASNFVVQDKHMKHIRGQDNLTVFKQSKTVGSGHSMANHFCATCGTLMYRVGAKWPGTSILRIGTVDDFNLHETKLMPEVELFVENRKGHHAQARGICLVRYSHTVHNTTHTSPTFTSFVSDLQFPFVSVIAHDIVIHIVMFATFDSKSPGTSASSNPSRDTASSTSTPQQTPRQKRQQVSRACDRCRTYRIKCDNDFPCTNCRSKDQQCSKKRGTVKTATLAQARHQIDHLEQRVKELELELQDERRASAANATPGTDSDVGFPALRGSSLSSPESDADATLSPVHHAADGLPTDKFSKGVYAKQRDSSQHTTWYGPGSLHYFALRLNRFLELSLPEAQPICNPLVVRHARPLDDSTVANDYLSPTQEQYFLDRYWQSYHTVFPVLDEADFKEHYTLLWAKPNRERKPSAVVDIMLALCIQDTAATTGDNQSPDDALHSDTAVPSHYRYYQRCRTLLLAELEVPTISTLQCQLLCTLYLCSRMLQNTADSTCAHAVRIAYMLGLHIDPPNSLPRRERELRKRLWWTLHVLETKISLKLGRPFLMHSSEATCPMPSDDYETAASGSSFAPLGENATWLTWSLHLTKLFRIARAASTDFYRRDIRCFHRGSKTAMVQSEACFGILKPHMDRLEQWTIDLPQVLQLKRQTGGRPFSIDSRGLTLEIEPFAPLWLQRQRFLLELMYHDLCTNLYRPFIPFDAMQHSGSRPLTDSAAVKCAAHATALTNILHEVLSKTSILAGFHEALLWQWNAALSLVGFVLAYRASPLMPALSTSRAAITTSVTVFELFAGMDGFSAAAGTAADILRELSAALDVIAPKNSASSDIEGLLAAPVPPTEMHAMDGNWFASPLQMPDIPDPFSCDDSVMQDLWTAEAELDLVNAADIYPGLDLLLPGSRVLGQGHWDYFQPGFDKD